MKSLILVPLFCLPFLPTADEAETAVPRRVSCRLDPVHSSMVFKVLHAGAANFYGRFDRIEGEFTLDPAKPEDGSVSIRIDAESVYTGVERRNNHLRGPDFFDAKQFPEITFTSKSIAKKGDDAFEVEGELAMHGVTKPLTLTAVKTGEGEFRRSKRIGYETTFTIKRSDFGMNFGLEGMLGDDVEVTVSVEGVVQGS